jgi:Tfp pilus assembly protein PilF
MLNRASAQYLLNSQATPWLLGALLVLGIVAVYGHTLHAPFIFDDMPGIVSNPQITKLTTQNIYSIWDRRFLPLFTFQLNYYVHQDNPLGYHLVNIAIHLVASLLVFLLIAELIRLCYRAYHWWIACAAGLTFALHPVQTQAITYMVQRLEAMAAMWYLLALWTYVKGRTATSKKTGWYAVSLIATLAAMHSKEIALTLPISLVLLEYTVLSRSWSGVRTRLFPLLPWLATLFIIPAYIFNIPEKLITAQAESSLLPSLNLDGVTTLSGQHNAVSRQHYFFTQLHVVMTYLRLVILPINQNLDYDYPLTVSLFSFPTLASLVVLMGLIMAGWLVRRRYPLTAFGLLFFFLVLSITSSIFPIDDVIFEHRLYLPLAGLICVGAEALVRCLPYTRSRWLIGAVALYLIVLGGATHQRNQLWTDSLAFWQDTAAKSPRKVRVLNNLGMAHLQREEWDKAEAVYLQALEIRPHFSEAHNNLALVYIQTNRLDEATQHLTRAIEIYPEYAHAHNNLGAILMQRSQLTDAEQHFKRAAEIDPLYSAAFDNIGQVYVKQRRLNEAEAAFQKALSIDDRSVVTHNNLGVVYAMKKNPQAAAQEFKRALELDPSYTKASENLKLVAPALPN